MIEVAGHKIYYVDFHCQWFDRERTALFLAGLSYCGFDAGLAVIPDTHDIFQRAATESGSPFVLLRGKEHCFQWGHFLTLGYEGNAQPNADLMEILRALRKKSAFIVFAHPLHPPTRPFLWDNGLTDQLLNDGVIDAVELVNGYNLQRDQEFVDWYQAQARQGRLIPVTGGCDTHYLQADRRPAIVYSEAFPPFDKTPAENDIDYLGGVRTLVLAAECTEAALISAVKNHRTIIEAAGQLLGPPPLVNELIRAGYWEKSKEDLEQRRSLSLSASSPVLLSGMKAQRLSVRRALSRGRLTIAGASIAVSGDTVTVPLPDIASSEERWVSATLADERGKTLTSALYIIQPLGLNFFGFREPDTARPCVNVTVVNRYPDTINGRVTASAGGHAPAQPMPLEQVAAGATWSESAILPRMQAYDLPSAVKVQVELSNCPPMALEKQLTFVACRRAREGRLNWPEAEAIRIDRADQVAQGNWDGPADASAEIRLLWSDAALHIRAVVRDDIHCQPFHGQDMWQGDGFQFGFDAEAMGSGTQSSMYGFETGLTDSGPELFCDIVPTIYPDAAIPPPMFFLPPECVAIEPAGGDLVYSVRMPWQFLRPIRAATGGLFRFFVLLCDNDGRQKETSSGNKSIMMWPGRVFLGWKSGTRHWPVITLLD